LTVLVGYVPTPQGEAALKSAVDAVRLRGEKLLVVNTSPGDAPADPRWASEEVLAQVRRDLEELGVDFEVRQLVGHDAAQEMSGPGRVFLLGVANRRS
jgi:hypothetical protein